MAGKWRDNLRLAFQALKMTLRGENVRRPIGKLLDWIEQSATLSAETLRQADALGINAAQRKAIVERVEGRNLSLDVALKTIRYHAETEYPRLIQDSTEHSLTAIYAINLNDRFVIQRFAENAERQDSPLKPFLQTLAAHLEAIPASNDLEN